LWIEFAIRYRYSICSFFAKEKGDFILKECTVHPNITESPLSKMEITHSIAQTRGFPLPL
jgi:hypothetical protein